MNIGSRQQGRLRAANVMDVPYDTDAILTACRKALDDQEFQNTCRTCSNPYGDGDAGTEIANTLAKLDLTLR